MRKGSFLNALIMLLIYITITMLTAVYAMFIKQGCYPCKTLLNSEWKSTLSDNCSSTKDDCGRCIQSYQAFGNADVCKPKDAVEVYYNGYAFIPNGASVTLYCIFQTEVVCAWSRRERSLEISNRYSYVSTRNDTHTEDCSIQINPFNDSIDLGVYECDSMVDPAITVAKEMPSLFTLYSDKVITGDIKTVTVNAPVGETVLLLCRFELEVDCFWTRRGQELDISGRYAFLHAKNGKQTKDCSLKINDLKTIDFGAWKCSSLANATTSTKVHLNEVTIKIPSMQLRPQNVTAMIGDQVFLTCEFDTEVPCYWQQNGDKVATTDRFTYVKSSTTETRANCSIIIEKFSEKDVGSWTCNYGGATTADFSSNTCAIDITPVKKPDPLKITVMNNDTERYQRAAQIIVDDEYQIICSSKNGNPATKLSWNMDGDELKYVTIVNKTGLAFDVEIVLDIAQNRNRFQGGRRIHVIQCRAEHPTFERTIIKEQEIILQDRNHIYVGETGFIMYILLAILIAVILIAVWYCKIRTKKIKSKRRQDA